MRRQRLSYQLVVAFALVLCSGGMAQASSILLNGISFANQLLQINPSSGAAVVIGPLDSDMAPFGIAYRGEQLYTYDQQADLIRQLDPLTGHTLQSINIGAGNLIGEGDLTFRGDGAGFLVTSPGSLYRFDITTGASTLITTALPLNIDGLAFGPNGVLYGFTDFTSFDLLTINPATGAFAIVGPLGLTTGILGGLSFDPSGELYAALNDQLFSINAATGAATLVGPISVGGGVSGIAFAPVPEPGTILLLGSGLAAIGGLRLLTLLGLARRRKAA
jgi:outer membrane protein assembly factor BamB